MAIKVEVAYATETQQVIVSLVVTPPCRIKDAIEQSGILKQFPEIDLTRQPIGVFSKRKQLTDLLRDGDRVEIYRPLVIDPKQARMARARKK